MATTVRPEIAPCDSAQGAGGALERTRFFARQLVTPDDLTQDQIYFREKLKRHNRLLHGWGVVCGACVRRGRGTCEVIVEPGYILGPYGDEVVIDREVTVDVCALGSGEQDGCCGDAGDPWCKDTTKGCPQGTLYLAVRYEECLTKPVRNPGGGCGCGCDDDACEYSRVRDGFSFAVLRDLPPPYTTPMRQPTIAAIYPCADRTARGCPPCPTGPWVILADIAMGDNCQVRAVDCFAHRRHVVSFGEFFWACPPRPGVTTGVVVAGQAPSVAVAHVMATMSGAGTMVDVGAALATTPPRATVTMRREDGRPVTVPAYFEVVAGETLADFLNREGDRELYDAESAGTIPLKTLFATAGAPASTRLTNTAATLALLEGQTLKGAPSRDTPASAPGALEGLIVARDLQRSRGTAEVLAELPAKSLTSIAADAPFSKRTAGMTIAAVAAQSEEEIVLLLTRGAPGKNKADREAKARAVWGDARKVVELGER